MNNERTCMAQTTLSARGVTILVLLVLGLIIFYRTFFGAQPQSVEDINQREDHLHQIQIASLGLLGMSNWEEIKKEALSRKELKVTDGKIDIGGKGTAFRREVVDTTVDSPNGVVLLLHGIRFKSDTWLELGTLHVMATYGYRMIAVDLPGYGQTEKIEGVKEIAFMTELLKSLRIGEAGRVIIVSPSMSGSYSLPFLMKHQEKFAGYVPVAPINTEKYPLEDYTKIQVPTSIIYGAKDTELGEGSLKYLRKLPNSEIHKIEAAGHACYLDQPLVFHKHLHEFAVKVFPKK